MRSNAAQRSCQTCGTDLEPEALEGLCPRCLGRLAFETAPNPWGAEGLRNPHGPRRFGDYELLVEIARGGMGVVYQARQLSLDRRVAVKMVLHGPFCSAEFVQRFQREAHTAASLHHPNIVPIYEVGCEAGQHYFSMEYIEGKNLAELTREGPLPARRAARYLQQMAEAMHYAHQQGVLHRDLKPSNVLLDSLDQPRITDFGLAKSVAADSQLTVTGQALGSPSHMPPEQAAGHRGAASPAGDIYSLGAVLYHLLTARPPFQGETLSEVLLQVQTAEPVPPRRLNPSVPADLQTICLKCLQKEPARRYASAHALAADLGHFLGDEPILARPVSPAQRAWLWCRRHPGPAVLSLALLVAVLLGLVGILLEWRQANTSAAGELKQRQLAEASAAKTRLNLYAADVNLAARAVERGDWGLARRTLANLQPAPGQGDLRGFEWRYLWNLCRGDELATLTGHTWIVTCAAFSPDGRWLVSGSQDGTAKVWDVERSAVRVTLPTGGAVWSTDFSADGALLMTAGHSGIQLWNPANWQLVTNFPGQLAVLSRQGSLLAAAESSPFYFESVGPVSLWDFRTGQKLREFPEPGRALALSPDGQTLAVAGARSGVNLWRTTDAKLLRRLPTTQSVWSLAFSPDGAHLVTAGWTSLAQVWDLKSESPPASLAGHALTVWSVRYSPDGARILTAGSDQTVRCWDARSLSPQEVFRGHDSEVWCAVFRPDGQTLASGGKDQTLRLWPARLPKRQGSLPHANLTSFLLSPDSSSLMLWQGEQAPRPTLWDAARGTQKASMPSGLAMGFTPDGQRVFYLVRSAGALDAWSPADGSRTQVALAEAPQDEHGYVRVGFSPECRSMFAIDFEGVIRLWEVANGKLLNVLHGPAPPIRSAVLSPGGRRLAVSVERENCVHLFDTQTGQAWRLDGHRDFVSGLAFSPDGSQLATGGMDALIRLWNANTGQPTQSFPGHMEEVTALAFSPDGRTLASLAHHDSLKLWHVPTQRELMSLNLPEAGCYLQFSPDGRRLVVATEQASVRLLEAPLGP